MTIAIVNATIIDGTGKDPVTRGTVVVENDRITAVGAGIDSPRDAEVIDADGRAVMPGMIDCHVHLFGKIAPVYERPQLPPSLQMFHSAKNAQRTLDSGFTAVRDAGGSPQGFKMALQQGLIPGPRIRISVGALSQTGGHGDETMPSGVRLGSVGGAGVEWPETVVDGADEVRRATRLLLRAGADFIKLHATGGVLSPTDESTDTGFNPEEIATMVYEAKARGKTCMAHAHGTQGIKNAVLAGVESIEHGSFLDDEAIGEMSRRGTFLVPTFVAGMWVRRYAERMPGSLHPTSLRKSLEMRELKSQAFRAALDGGVRVAFGTDMGVGPHGRNAEELGLLVEAGMSPMQALVAVTKTASECIHMADEIGTLEPGKLADLLLVDGNPLDDVTMLMNRDKLLMIMQGGSAHKNALATEKRALA
jgi:imidazolonepropionase-like amidohydrolase